MDLCKRTKVLNDITMSVILITLPRYTQLNTVRENVSFYTNVGVVKSYTRRNFFLTSVSIS